jgi:opacity protein-like surface antigen
MKKLVATAAAAALLGTAAFAADVKIGGWGRGVWLTGNGVNEEGDGNDIYTSATKSWGGTGPRVGMNFSVETENIGVFTEFHAEEQQFSDYRIWWSPVEQLKVFFGTNPNHFRGDAVYGMWDIYRVGAVDRVGRTNETQQEEGWTFMSHSCKGTQILATPVEGLKLVAALEYPLTKEASTSSNVKNVLGRQSKFAAAYDIDGVGTVKAGLTEKGNVCTDDEGNEKAQNILNVAFDLTAVENLKVSVGAFVPLVQKIDGKNGWGNQVNAYVKYNADALTVHARVGTLIGAGYTDDKGKAEESGFGFLVGGAVEYAIADGLSIIGEVDYASNIYANLSTADNMDVLDFGIAISKSYSNGKIVAGFEGRTNNNNNYLNAYTTEKADQLGWCVPICFEYWF